MHDAINKSLHKNDKYFNKETKSNGVPPDMGDEKMDDDNTFEYRNTIRNPGINRIRTFILGLSEDNQEPTALTSLRRLEQESL